MCGIVGYIGNREAKDVLIEGLIILQNRGYDSAGISTIDSKGNLITTKNASKETTSDSIKYLSETLYKHAGSTIGISHTRWASCGGVNMVNSHPHNDVTGRFSLVHNGVIENHNHLRKFLLDNGIRCISDTDTEVIVQLIYYYSLSGLDFENSVKEAVSKLEGTWGIAILDKENPNKIIACRHGSPILLGVSQNETFIASEAVAFQKYTNQYISLNNDEIAVITLIDDKIDISLSDNYEHSTNSTNNRIKLVAHEEILLTPDPYPHWTIREINEQPYTITAALNNGGRIINNTEVALGGLNMNKEKLLKIKDLIIVGCGTSRHSGLFISDIMRTMCNFNTVQVVDGSEFDKSYIRENVGLLALSQSGETKDIMRCLELIADKEITSFSVVNRVESQIARTTGCGVYLNAGREVAVASTKAFTSQIVILSLISIWYAQNRNINIKKREKLIENLRRLSYCYQTILSSKIITEKCLEVANYLKDWTSCFVLGKGLSSYIAFEGALKLKEIGYIHAEGYPGGSLKHGPFALIDKGVPIIIILLDDSDRSYMESTVSEVKAREAYTIVITNISEYNEGDINIHLPKNGILSALLAVVPLQLIAYNLSVIRGIDADKPRHLAKVISII